MIKDKNLVISLIKDDLINTKLIKGLGSLGLNTDNYFLHLSDTVLKLMDIEDKEENETQFERYMELSDKVLSIDIAESHQQVERLALEIYNELNSYSLKLKFKDIPP